MKIVVNTRFLLKNKLEGVGWFTYETLIRLVRNYPEHEFIFLFDRPCDPSFIFATNVKPLVLFPPARHPFLWYIWFEIAVKNALKRLQPDVFLSMDGYCVLQTKIPTVMVAHDVAYLHYAEQVPFWVRKYYQYYVPRFLSTASRIVTVSAYTKSDIVRHYNLSSDKIAVACNGCRNHFVPLTQPSKQHIRDKYTDGQPYFFYLGAMHPRKNIARLLHAFAQFKQKTQSPIKLMLGGRLAWDTSDVKQAYDQHPYKNDIILLGYVDDKLLPSLLGAAMALTYVSLFEGFGIPILEAMQCEVPVLTSNVSSMPEVSGDAALLVDPTSVSAIANGMTKLAADEELRAQLIRAGQQQRNLFTWERAADVIYNNLIQAAHPSK
ncbi:MAG: glycosyltransferase family 1 protein [Bacteroidota bacterium]